MSYISKGMTSSADQTWETPQAVFDALNAVWCFTFDVAASPFNAKCPRYFTEADDALSQDWGREVCWCNPPYGRKLAAFVRKARLAAEQGATVVMLIPARTDTRYWHDEIFPHAKSIHFVKGRIRFGNGACSAPFPSAVVVFGGDCTGERFYTIDFRKFKTFR